MEKNTSERMIEAARRLAQDVDKLRFSEPVAHIYNPLIYAWPAHELYLKKFANSPKQIVFVGMNPGPFGMVQTGIPFGEIPAARDWLGISSPIARPSKEHPQRPILGFDCARCEISGQRLWGLFTQRFGTAEIFFRDHFVLNYCPLAFLEESGRNLTPDKLSKRETERLFAKCDAHFREVVEILQPQWLVGVGGFAFRRIEQVAAGSGINLAQILHPSPASPAANREWAKLATEQLEKCGAWRAS